MPNVKVDYSSRVSRLVLHHLSDKLPRIVASEMNVSGRRLHDGGVGLREIIVKFREQSEFDRNVNEIQITVYAHNFEERVKRHKQIKDSILSGVQHELDYMQCTHSTAVEVRLIPIEYGTINKNH